MPNLTKDELKHLFSESLSVMPNVTDQEKLMSDIEAGKLKASTSSPETLALANQCSKYQSFILDAAVEKLLRCDVVLVPAPICNARASYRGGKPLITLFDGFLDVAIANIEMSHVIQNLPDKLDQIFPKKEFETVSLTAWLAVLFNSLIGRFISHREPLPNFEVLLDSALSRNVEHAFLGTLWWVLLHELGHIQLGHLKLSGQNNRLTISNDGLVLPQELSEFQVQEIEADAFVFDCLKTESKKMFYYWTSHALGPGMMFETLSGKVTDSHPLNINRLYRALLLSEGLDTQTVDLKAKEHLTRHSHAHSNIGAYRKTLKAKGYVPLFENWSRDDIFISLNGLSGTLGEIGVNIEPFLDSYSSGWRKKFN